MTSIRMGLLRGVCQMPAYVAKERGLFAAQGVDVELEIHPTAWTMPDRLERGEMEFAVIPWTRVVASHARGDRLMLVCGSGCDEAAMVVRTGYAMEDVRTVAVPQRGGIKELTAGVVIDSLGWQDRAVLRCPSGDGAILALVGQAADAAAMVEPYATMLEELGIGVVVRRTGDIWRGAPGCSLATSAELLEESPDLARRVVAAFVQGARFIDNNPEDASEIAAAYIGVHARFIRKALDANRPRIHAVENAAVMDEIMTRMLELGYLTKRPRGFIDLQHLQAAVRGNT